MRPATLPSLEFRSQAFGEGSFLVDRIYGREGLSEGYRFELELRSELTDPDLGALMTAPAWLELPGGGRRHGVLASIRQGRALHGGGAAYRAILVPRMQRLARVVRSQVFQDVGLEALIALCLKEGGLGAEDYVCRFSRDYEPWDFLCQYRENGLDHLNRRLEREGVYTFFEQGEDRERLVLADAPEAHRLPDGAMPFQLLSPASADPPESTNTFQSFEALSDFRGGPVRLRDHWGQHPEQPLVAGEPDLDPGAPSSCHYGEGLRGEDDARRQALLRDEEAACAGLRFLAQGTAPPPAPGCLLELEGHYRSGFDGRYLVVSLEHRVELGSHRRQRYLCELMPAGRPFRSGRRTPWPRVAGLVGAVIDASGEGEAPELDEEGRYKVILSLDGRGLGEGRASAWVRMLQPYAGEGYGFHAPLRKGAQVMLAFQEGDPDRPLIAGALGSPGAPSVVTSGNPTQVRLQTAGGGYLCYEDAPGGECLRQGLAGGPHLLMGMAPGPGETPSANGGEVPEIVDGKEPGRRMWNLTDVDWFRVFAGARNTFVGGDTVDMTGGLSVSVCGPFVLNLNAGLVSNINAGGFLNVNWGKVWFVNARSEVYLHEHATNIASKREDITKSMREYTYDKDAVGDYLRELHAKHLELEEELTRVSGRSTTMANEHEGVFGTRSVTAGQLRTESRQSFASTDSAVSLSQTSVEQSRSRSVSCNNSTTSAGEIIYAANMYFI